MNIGAEKPEEYGNYYAWGELETKEKYSEDDCKWCGVDYSDLKVYGVIDANGNLTAEYDVATQNWGENCSLPTLADIEELLSLPSEAAVMYDVKGRRFIGTNGNTVFFPYSGLYSSYLRRYGELGYYWCSTAIADADKSYFKDMRAGYLDLYDGEAKSGYHYRYEGFAVRAVIRGNNPVDTIPTTPIDTVPVTPIDTTPSTPTPSIPVAADDDYVDLGLESGTLWAIYNVGATKAEEYGGYFTWGETETKNEYSEAKSKWYGVEYEDLEAQGVIDADGNLTAKYDAATANWGEKWRMPTDREIEELCALESEDAVVNGVMGRQFAGKNGNTLFVPYIGSRYDNETDSVDEDGTYWSSKATVDDKGANDLYVSPDAAIGGYYRRYWGFGVRAVRIK